MLFQNTQETESQNYEQDNYDDLSDYNLVQKQNCIFCQKCVTPISFTFMINRALFSKFSASQNYYYTKDINDIIAGSRTVADEFLKRFYKKNEYANKIKMLTEYYKFHKDISRLFMLPTTYTLNKFHDKKRRLEYLRITKLLQQEEEEQQQSKASKGSKAAKNNKKGSYNEIKTKHYQPQPIQDRVLLCLEEESIAKKKKNNTTNNTIQELNNKLADIIQNQSHQTINFDKDEIEIGNLSNFINYLKQKSNTQTPSVIFDKGLIESPSGQNNQPQTIEQIISANMKKKLQMPKRTQNNQPATKILLNTNIENKLGKDPSNLQSQQSQQQQQYLQQQQIQQNTNNFKVQQSKYQRENSKEDFKKKNLAQKQINQLQQEKNNLIDENNEMDIIKTLMQKHIKIDNPAPNTINNNLLQETYSQQQQKIQENKKIENYINNNQINSQKTIQINQQIETVVEPTINLNVNFNFAGNRQQKQQLATLQKQKQQLVQQSEQQSAQQNKKEKQIPDHFTRNENQNIDFLQIYNDVQKRAQVLFSKNINKIKQEQNINFQVTNSNLPHQYQQQQQLNMIQTARDLSEKNQQTQYQQQKIKTLNTQRGEHILIDQQIIQTQPAIQNNMKVSSENSPQQLESSNNKNNLKANNNYHPNSIANNSNPKNNAANIINNAGNGNDLIQSFKSFDKQIKIEKQKQILQNQQISRPVSSNVKRNSRSTSSLNNRDFSGGRDKKAIIGELLQHHNLKQQINNNNFLQQNQPQSQFQSQQDYEIKLQQDLLAQSQDRIQEQLLNFGKPTDKKMQMNLKGLQNNNNIHSNIVIRNENEQILKKSQSSRIKTSQFHTHQQQQQQQPFHAKNQSAQHSRVNSTSSHSRMNSGSGLATQTQRTSSDYIENQLNTQSYNINSQQSFQPQQSQYVTIIKNKVNPSRSSHSSKYTSANHSSSTKEKTLSKLSERNDAIRKSLTSIAIKKVDVKISHKHTRSEQKQANINFIQEKIGDSQQKQFQYQNQISEDFAYNNNINPTIINDPTLGSQNKQNNIIIGQNDANNPKFFTYNNNNIVNIYVQQQQQLLQQQQFLNKQKIDLLNQQQQQPQIFQPDAKIISSQQPSKNLIKLKNSQIYINECQQQPSN